MKLKFERYPGISCFYVRGPVETAKIKVLLVSLETILKDQEEPIIIHMGYATLAAQEAAIVSAYKKKLTVRKFPLYWISSERTVGDIATMDLLIPRVFYNPKTVPIAAHIKLEDEIYAMHMKGELLQREIGKMGGSEESVEKTLLENEILKAQKQALEQTISSISMRLNFQSPLVSEDKDILVKIEKLRGDLAKILGSEVPL